MELLHNLEDKLISVDAPTSEKPHLRLAAVLIPIFVDNDTVLFTKRTESLKQHQGQIAFPGGRFEDSDQDLAETALRETEEEVGISRKHIKLVGRLEPKISTSRHYVYPYVGFVQGKPQITINDLEVQEYFFSKLEHLLNPDIFETGFYKGGVRKYYVVEDYKIWGLTQIILSEFLDLIQKQ